MTGKSNVVKPGVLNEEQQEKLKQFKSQTRINNENYLRSHPELDILIGDFLRAVLLQRPVDVRDFAAEFFTDPNLQSNTLSKLDKTGDSERPTVK
ncbi:RIIa domain-containing protein 1-like isoform X1 [Eucyclogobius newberryi]|uniref:RIIa domain-containing protein 1-like isoform X1 n=1 Tax=Eucyclogobius newberryi TaxID=166745 RepID=UPI003B5C63F7